MRAIATSVLMLVAPALACTPPTLFSPTVVAPGELTLAYDHGMAIHAGTEPLARGPVYLGLDEFVHCVPRAHDHARAARRAGKARVGLAWAGGTSGVVALGGASGAAFVRTDPDVGWGLLGGGLGLGVIAAILAGVSRHEGNRAHGNAIDALNYYNDELGSRALSCAEVDRFEPVLTPSSPRPVPASEPAPPGRVLELRDVRSR